MSINRVTISGNLTRDPDVRSTQGGMSILGFGVAVNDRRKNPQTGEWEDYPNFVDCVCFGKRADSLARILRKGMRVMVDGKLRYSTWERDGQKRSKIEIIADDVDLPPRGNAQQGQGQYQGAQPTYSAPQQGYGAQTYPPAMPQQTYPQPAPAPAPQPPAPQQPVQQPLAGMPTAQAPTIDMYDEDIPF